MRSKLGAFIHSSWTNLNIRAGKYKHLQTKSKCQTYANICLEFTLSEYKNWCYKNKEIIFSLKRPSLDRIDLLKNYSLDNIQIIELSDNIRKKRPGSAYLNGPKSKLVRGVRKIRNKWLARIKIKQKETYLGSFVSKKDALAAFTQAYITFYGKKPW